jgi:hypothetical protein
MMKSHSQEVAAAFGEALAGDLVTLTATAARLPAWFNPDQAASLDPATFKGVDPGPRRLRLYPVR